MSAAAVAATGVSHAAADAANVRLPSYQRVSHYDVALLPDLVRFTFQGQVRIRMDLLESSDRIVLHSIDCTFPMKEDGRPRIDIKHIEKDTILPCSTLSLDTKSQTVTFHFDSHLEVGLYELEIHYEGILNDQLAGFYRSSYKSSTTGETKYMAVTQFEATDCRRAVPCIDEPAAKATFDVTLFVAPNLTAVSNMPIKERITVGTVEEEGPAARGLKFEPGLVRYTYYTSPIMSTYLLAFVIGEFDYISSISSSGTEVRVYTGLGKTHLGRFSLDVAVRALEFYNQYFGISYPLPKMDLLAIPDFAAGAMENWGCITYRETALLIDENNSSAAVMQRVARTVCHEIAHMVRRDNNKQRQRETQKPPAANKSI